MKKLYIFILTAGLMLSCSEDLEDMNVNIKYPASVSSNALFTGVLKNLVDQMASTSVNRNIFRLFSQHWTQTTYIDESNYNLSTRGIPKSLWIRMYRTVLKNLQIATNISKEEKIDDATKNNKQQLIEILNVYSYSILAECFGDIPYSQSLDINILSPKYDDAATVYSDLISRLDAAISKLDLNAGSFGSADILYHGNVAAWKKFAVSLKLRMGMLLADVDGAKAKSVVESAASAGVFTSNAENAALKYKSTSPNTNPVYVSLVTSGRSDFVVANTLVDFMQPRLYNGDKIVAGSVKYTDPRAKFYFDSNVDADPSTSEVVYLGGIYGSNNSFAKYTHIGKKLHQPTYPGIILDYSEVEFLLAEAAARGYSVGGTAEEHYNKAVTASIEYWGGTVEDAKAFLKLPQIAYSTASGNYKQKIGMQKWVAMYNRGYTAWRSWRRLDFPKLVAPAKAQVDKVPTRYTYPIEEQTLNSDSWGAAKGKYEGDKLTAKLFWDVN